jgi:hypothetical protein
MKDRFWDMTPCDSSRKSRRFVGTYRLHHHGNETPNLEVGDEVTLPPAVTRPVCLRIGHPSGTGSNHCQISEVFLLAALADERTDL